MGVYEDMNKLESLILKFDPPLFSFLKNHNIEVAQYAFRWLYCLLLREFPVFLSVVLLDHYFLQTEFSTNSCVDLSLALMLKFSKEIQSRSKDEALIFLHKLPTDNWGFRDMNELIAEKNELVNRQTPK